MFTTQ